METTITNWKDVARNWIKVLNNPACTSHEKELAYESLLKIADVADRFVELNANQIRKPLF